MAIEIWVNIGSGNGLLPDGTKPLPEPMLTDHQWSPVTFILGQFHKRCLTHQSLKFFPRGQWVKNSSRKMSSANPGPYCGHLIVLTAVLKAVIDIIAYTPTIIGLETSLFDRLHCGLVNSSRQLNTVVLRANLLNTSRQFPRPQLVVNAVYH